MANFCENFAMLAIFTTLFFPLVASLEVTLLDTTKEDTLNWTKYPFGPQSQTPGWIEESFTNFEKGINWRSYVVCDVQFRKVDNWLWTPFIERGPAKRIFIEMKFSVRDCSMYPGETRTCKETFSLLYYEFDVATREPPPWQPESYVLVDRIAADEGRFSQNSEVIINSEIRSVPVTKKGLYFAFRDQGGCISLLAIRVYYVTCPEIVSNLTRFPSTPTGPELTSVERAEGRCVANASPATPDEKLALMCKGDGSWFYQQGECHCNAGYEASEDAKSCRECPPGRFKPSSDPGGVCRSCPPHSSAPHPGLSRCRCDDGYYRAPFDPEEMACTRPPSAPQNLTVNFVDQSTVILSWNHPHDSGGRRDTTYRISCDACGNTVSYAPSRVADGNFNETKVTIMGLKPVTTYTFKVFAENGVTPLVQNYPSKFVDITVTTDARIPSRVTNVRVMDVKLTEITLAWDPPPGPVTYIEMYEVKFFARGVEKHAVTTLTKKQLLTFRELRARTEYGFQVRAKVAHGWGEYSQAIYRTTGQILAYVGEEQGSQVHVIALSIVGAAVGIIALVVLVVYIRKRRSGDECNKKPPSDCDTLEYRNGEVPCPADNPPIITTHMTNMTTPLFNHLGTQRTYVDPHTYEDPNQAVKDFAREIDASCITIEAIIGGGEFGDVCRGKLKYPGRPEICVAIKTLKPGSTDKARKDFLTEASIMGQFEHPNVIFLQGVVTKSNPIMIITEYMENGSLDTFLRANDSKFQVAQLVSMLRGISSGMQYLSEMNYVHRDLAARNVLVNAQLVCKIADFGLSREIESAAEGAYTTRGGKIPVRWTAPEAIAYRKFTWASDVWSYGIVMWEVMSFGERPYWNWSNQDVIKAIERGYRLPAPMDCPEAIHQLMLDCWQKDRTNRPIFASIVMTLDKLLQCPETLRKTTMNRRPPPLNPYYAAPLMLAEDHAWVLYPKTKLYPNPYGVETPDLTKFATVEEWLCSIKMGRYWPNFQAAGVQSLEEVAKLTPADLDVIGVALLGHQKKILNNVQTMRAQMSINVSDGFLV